MSNYVQTKRLLEKALNEGKIDINFYHSVCVELDKSLSNKTIPHYYSDANKTALSK